MLDEPLSSLDDDGVTAVHEVVDMCRGTENEVGYGLLLITHQVKSLELADVVVVLKEGQVVERGSFDLLRANPSSELRRVMPDLV